MRSGRSLGVTVAWLTVGCFGFLFALSLFSLTYGLALGLSPFPAVFLSIFTGMVFYLMRNLEPLTVLSLMTSKEWKLSAGLGVLLMSGLTLVPVGLFLGSSPLVAALLLSMSPIATLLVRKCLWGESFSKLQRFGILMSVLASLVLFLFDLNFSNGLAMQTGAALSRLQGDGLIFLAAILIGCVFGLPKTSSIQSPMPTLWIAALLIGALLAFPLLMSAHYAFFSTLSVFPAGLPAENRGALYFSALGPFVMFGLVAIFCRLFWLGGASRFLPVGKGACTWVSVFLLTAFVCAFFSDIPFSLAHVIALALHLGGLFLAQNDRCCDKTHALGGFGPMPSHSQLGLRDVNSRR